jgi:hypothetical protein
VKTPPISRRRSEGRPRPLGGDPPSLDRRAAALAARDAFDLVLGRPYDARIVRVRGEEPGTERYRRGREALAELRL